MIVSFSFLSGCAHRCPHIDATAIVTTTQSPVTIQKYRLHYCDVKMGEMASQITSLTIVYSTVHSAADQRKYQSSASLAFLRGIHRWPVNSPHIWPVTRKIFPFDDVIMETAVCTKQKASAPFKSQSIGLQRHLPFTYIIRQIPLIRDLNSVCSTLTAPVSTNFTWCGGILVQKCG